MHTKNYTKGRCPLDPRRSDQSKVAITRKSVCEGRGSRGGMEEGGGGGAGGEGGGGESTKCPGENTAPPLATLRFKAEEAVL